MIPMFRVADMGYSRAIAVNCLSCFLPELFGGAEAVEPCCLEGAIPLRKGTASFNQRGDTTSLLQTLCRTKNKRRRDDNPAPPGKATSDNGRKPCWPRPSCAYLPSSSPRCRGCSRHRESR